MTAQVVEIFRNHYLNVAPQLTLDVGRTEINCTMTGSTWPGSAPYALCLTHDVDRVCKQLYHYVYYGLRSGVHGAQIQLRSLAERLRGREPYWNFNRIMELEQGLGVRSTVLLLNETATGLGPRHWGRYNIESPEIKRAIRDLDSGGWEIGLHGSFFSYKDIDLLRREKQTLEDIVGRPVRSTRQHYLNLDRERTWRIQREIGLEVDSSVGFADHAWDARDGVLPYFPDDSGIIEIPITLMDTIGLTNADVRRQALNAVERVEQSGGLVVLDWHQRTFAPGEYAEAVDLYVRIIRRAKDQGAWIATMGEVGKHWRTQG